MKISTVILMLLCMHLVGCTDKRETVRACGRSLSELLSFVCHGNYNGPRAGKRGSYQSEENKLFDDNIFKVEDLFYRRMRVPRGVADECCHRPCSFSTLQSYCGSGDN